MRNDDHRPDRPSTVDPRLALAVPLKLDGTASGGMAYAATETSAAADGMAATRAKTGGMPQATGWAPPVGRGSRGSDTMLADIGNTTAWAGGVMFTTALADTAAP